MIEDVEALRRKGKEYAKHSIGRAVLKQADGVRGYIEIAKIVEAHPTTVSALLKRVEKFGFATRISPGVYKKTPGAFSYIPDGERKHKTMTSVRSFSKRKVKVPKQHGAPTPSVGIPAKISNSLSVMSTAYSQLFRTENVLRELVRQVLGGDKDWWNKRVPPVVIKQVQETRDKTPYHAPSRGDDLEYTHLGQLKEIIVAKQNWKQFLPYLNEKDKSAFQTTVVRAISFRHAIAHTIPLATGDQKVVGVRFDDILRMIK